MKSAAVHDPIQLAEAYDLSFKVYYELMANKVAEILLVSSPYDAFIMEEDGRLAERIIHEYRGLNLSRPPMLTWVSTASAALAVVQQKHFDMVIVLPRLNDMDVYELCSQIKAHEPELAIFILAHNAEQVKRLPTSRDRSVYDQVFVWTGNTDLLLAMIKSVEDRRNVAFDTERARVRVIIMVEDAPLYRSSMLPLLYKEIVVQTQAVMGDSLNDDHRLLRMRARPKILLAETHEEALSLYYKFKPYLLAVLSDVRFPVEGRLDDKAGFRLLRRIRQELPDIPLLNLSSEESNRQQALNIPAVFINKNAPTLHRDIRTFFITHLGFGDFIFRMPDGREAGRASNLRQLEKMMPSIPDESVYQHAIHNHFSAWLMARSEIMLASKLKAIRASDFPNASAIKQFLVSCLALRRKGRQRGIITDFVPGNYDSDADFMKLGKGSLGGKARGLAFVSIQLKEKPALQKAFPGVVIRVPKTLVISTEGFDDFIAENNLKRLALGDHPDAMIQAQFLEARLPDWLLRDLTHYIEQADFPLAVRSSSLLEDAQYQPFAGLYKTYMIPNNAPQLKKRLDQLVCAIKMVYASTYFKAPRAFARNTMHRIEEEKMAVILQELTGSAQGAYFYPAVAGVAQSYNFYPFAHMKPEEGIAHIAYGLGRMVVEGGSVARFSPKYPEVLPQFSTVESVLANSQKAFYALKLEAVDPDFVHHEDSTLVKLDLFDARSHKPLAYLASTYIHQDHRIRDVFMEGGSPVLTFANLLKYGTIPLAQILADILNLGREGMGGSVEIEFALDLASETKPLPEFSVLQIRPMTVSSQNAGVQISADDRKRARCYSSNALGNGIFNTMSDIVYVDPQTFDPAQTTAMAAQVGTLNNRLVDQERPYLLIGPGRWGSADRWLGIPVVWSEICGVGAMVETAFKGLRADPSQGSHFFHNITSLGISYLTIQTEGRDAIDWEWLRGLSEIERTEFVRHVRTPAPMTLKSDGKTSQAVVLAG